MSELKKDLKTEKLGLKQEYLVLVKSGMDIQVLQNEFEENDDKSAFERKITLFSENPIFECVRAQMLSVLDDLKSEDNAAVMEDLKFAEQIIEEK